MTEAPLFFVPMATPDNQEIVYAELASWCGREIPSLERRIYSIVFVHDRDEWTASVGDSLRGKRFRTTRSHGMRTERERSISDPAVVLAIFPGVPYMVVTNYGSDANQRSAWVNPFLAGVPKSVTYFSIPKAS